MIPHELKMRHEPTETVPAGEGLYTHHQTAQFSIGGNERIDFFSEPREVAFRKRTVRYDNKHTFVSQQLKLDHSVLFYYDCFFTIA